MNDTVEKEVESAMKTEVETQVDVELETENENENENETTANHQQEKLIQIIEAALLSADDPLPIDQLLKLFEVKKTRKKKTNESAAANDLEETAESEEAKKSLDQVIDEAHEHVLEEEIPEVVVAFEAPTKKEIKNLLEKVMPARYENFGFRLKKLASGYTFQVQEDFAPWIARLFEQKPQRYTRAFLETLVIIAYRQPVTRAEIESIRGVAVSTHIIKTLQDRNWIKVIGHRDVPGRPEILGTTKEFLDYFNLTSLNDLPGLEEIKDLDKIAEQIDGDLDEALQAQLELEVE